MKSSCLCRQTRIFIIIPIALLLFTAMAPPAAAVPITWNVSGEILPYTWGYMGPKPEPEGTLSGWFTYDASTQKIGEWSIMAAVNPVLAPTGLTNPFIFNPNNSTAQYGEPAVSNVIYFSENATTTWHSFVQLAFVRDLLPPNDVYLYSYPNPDGSAFVAQNPWYVGWITGQLTPTSVPEPSTLLLLAAGLMGIIGFRKKFRK